MTFGETMPVDLDPNTDLLTSLLISHNIQWDKIEVIPPNAEFEYGARRVYFSQEPPDDLVDVASAFTKSTGLNVILNFEALPKEKNNAYPFTDN